jgi:hypothetical protein
VTRLAHAAVASLSGAYDIEPGPDGTPFRWLGARPSLHVVGSGLRGVAVSFEAVSPEIPRVAHFGRRSRDVLTGPTRIRLCVATGQDNAAVVPISTSPTARHLPGATRVFRTSASSIFGPSRAAAALGNV